MASMYRKGMVGFSGGNNASFAREGGQGSQPVGAGRGPIRTAMANDSFKYSLKDRMAARQADKAMKGVMAPPADQGMTQPTSRLDASPTPGLDAQNQGSIRYATKEGRMAEQRAATEKSSLSGAFGQRAQKKAENLQGRKALYRDMQASPIQPQFRPDLAKRATDLGVDGAGFQRGMQSSLGISSPARSSWKNPPPLTADMGKADVRPGKKKRGM